MTIDVSSIKFFAQAVSGRHVIPKLFLSQKHKRRS